MNPKVKSLLAHLTLIGWLLALVLNSLKKDFAYQFLFAASSWVASPVFLLPG